MERTSTIKGRCYILLLCLFFSLPLFADLRVGTVFLEPPFVFSAGDTGFDVDLMRTLCARLNQKCNFVPMRFKQLFGSLDMGTIDLAIAAIAITATREAQYIFSLPYMLSTAQFLTRKDLNFTSLNDLKGKRVGVRTAENNGGVFYQYLVSEYQNQFEIEQYNDISDAVTALANKKIDAVFLHAATADYWVQNSGDQFVTLADPIVVGYGLGIMSVPQNGILIQEINEQLVNIEKDGTYLNLYRNYFTE